MTTRADATLSGCSIATSRPKPSAERAISIDAANQIHFNRRPVRQDELPDLLAALKAEQAAPMVHINGDAQSELGTTIAVLDAVRRSGIVRIAFETRPATP